MKNSNFQSQSLLLSFLFLCVFSMFVVSCGESENITNLSSEEDEYTLPGEIIDFDIKGASVIDGVLTFESHDDYIDARYVLANHNEESIIAWTHKMGFESLFLEKLRLESLTSAEVESEISEGINNQLFVISEENGDLELQFHSPINARIFNKDGIFRVGEYVGTIGFGMNIWTTPENTDLLIEAISTSMMEDTEPFIIIDNRAFSLQR